MSGAVSVDTPHRGRLFSVQVLTWTDGAGRTVRREVVRHPGAVLVVPILPDGRIVMIRNHRVAVGGRLWELPAGTLEAGEDPARAAARELQEETGYRAGSVERLAEFYTSPGFCDELMRVFVARGLEPVERRLEPGEDIEVEILAPPAVLSMIERGEIKDGKSIAALLLWARRRDAGR